MRNINNKSVHVKKNKKDGMRICVMRRIRPEYDFDLWIPKLAPQEKLLKDYVISKKISWQDFSKKYKRQTLSKNKKLLKMLLILSKKSRITLLCSEKSYKKCHRKLIMDELKVIKSHK